MTLHDAAGQACFLCTLDPQGACREARLEGRIVAARERVVEGEKASVLVLDTGTERVEVLLEYLYYRSLVREIRARGSVIRPYDLTLRVYHLPSPPTINEYKGESRRCYRGNSYTLAVVQPDILLNITDLSQAEYCSRQYLLNRLAPSPPSPATIRGNLVHHCFKELLKAESRGDAQLASADNEARPGVREALMRYMEQALEINSVDLALANLPVEAMRADVIPHLESLAHWYERERTTLWNQPVAYPADVQPDANGAPSSDVESQVRAETFLLAPEIGLRGRLDLFWQHAGRQRLLELKTGGASGNLPKSEHRWQVLGYHSLLTVRRDSKMKRAQATLLYSGTPGSAQAHGIPSTIREIQRVNERRMILVISQLTGIPPAPPGPSRCTKCAKLSQCQDVSAVLQWQPPEPEPSTISPDVAEAEGSMLQLRPVQARTRFFDTEEDRAFFATYYHLLHIEGQVGEQQQALLWNTPVEERLERGTAIQDLYPDSPPQVERDGWQQTFRCSNTSELREGDEVLLSDGNPVTGEVVSGSITEISSERVTVWTRELIATPRLLDRYDNDLVHVRTLQNLLRWLQVEQHLRDLVAGKIRPRFVEQPFTGRSDFNTEQNLAVQRALQMRDYLLIHGPPGTGKTSVIAEIVKRLVQQGQRVMLVAFTNQAVDNMLKRLDREGFHTYLRLGHERSVDEKVRPHLLKHVTDRGRDPQAQPLAPVPTQVNDSDPEVFDFAAFVQDTLYTTPVVASTTATWSSDKYVPTLVNGDGTPGNTPGLHFDVAIVDEAGQLTVPAILGALRLASRFILVGDEKQLPPLVLSKEAAEQGLSASLFTTLKYLDEDYMKSHSMTISACVPLRVQYRMNKWISNFSSTVFYNQQLIPHESIADRVLALHKPKYPLAPGNPAMMKAISPHFPLTFLDVYDAQELSQVKMSNIEASAVRDVVAALLAWGIQERDIGIIAPYRAQVANIRRHLFSAAEGWPGLSSDSPLSVDTVDRFQGGERLVIIMSFATSHEPEPQSQLREFLTNPNRLNVALTRAQRKLILVGHAAALESLPIFSRLITYCRSMKTLLPYEPQPHHSPVHSPPEVRELQPQKR